MSYEGLSTLHDIEAALALVALAGAILLVVARLIPTVASVRFLDAVHRVQLQLAALVAVSATLGSLYFSEFNENWIPCRFCWFQRIFMFSSAVILLIAAIRKDRGIKWYVAPLAGIGILLSIWHILIEHRVVEESSACFNVQSCASPYRVSFGTLDFSSGTLQTSGLPITLAVMAFSAFAAILALLFLPEPLSTDTPEAEEDGES